MIYLVIYLFIYLYFLDLGKFETIYGFVQIVPFTQL
jgi:hypothetical protein